MKENYDQLFGKVKSLSKLMAEMPSGGSGLEAAPVEVAGQTEAAREIIGNIDYYRAEPIEDMLSKKRMDQISKIPVQPPKRRER